MSETTLPPGWVQESGSSWTLRRGPYKAVVSAVYRGYLCGAGVNTEGLTGWSRQVSVDKHDHALDDALAQAEALLVELAGMSMPPLPEEAS